MSRSLHVVKIDWLAAPEWAKYAAMDKDGRWFYHEARPHIFYDGWRNTGQIRLVSFESMDWRESLTEAAK